MAIQLKREKLYEDIWRLPIGQLSLKLGIAAFRLRDACRTMAIPVPPLGHWNAVRAGSTINIPPLPPHDGPYKVDIGAIGRESLADWVMRTTPTKPAPEKSAPVRPLSPSTKQPRLVPLAVWAELLFGEYVPHKNTLLRWVHDGRIYPQPVKVGKKWFVKPDAEYQGD